MYFTTLTIATLLTVGYASPTSVPGVNIAPEPQGAKIIANSWVVLYKDHTTDKQLDDHYNDIAKKLGKKPTAKININGFKAITLETDLPGLGRVGTSPLVSHTAPE
jgi:hypothetical protein